MLGAVVAAAAVLAGLLAWVYLSSSAARAIGRRIDQAGVPSVPSSIPFLGHLLPMLKGGAPWDIISSWVLESPGIVHFSFFNDHFVGIRDRDMLKRVLQSKFGIYKKDLTTYAPFMCLLGTGLVTSEGELWKKQRTKISSAFRVEILDDVKKISVDAVERLSTKLEKAKQSGEVMEMGEEFRKLTLQVIGEAVLSLSAEESDRVFPELYLPIVTEANLLTFYPFRKYLPLPATLRHTNAIRTLDRFVTDLLNRRHEEFVSGRRKNDILDRLLEAVSDEQWSESVVRQMRDEIKTFLFAGHETSSSMLTWTLYELSRPENSAHLARVLAEAEDLFGDASKTWNELREMDFTEVREGLRYTANCLREAVRKYSIVPLVTRELAEDDEIVPNLMLPKGTKVVVPIQAVHHDPELWPDPKKYNPERFEGSYDTFSFLAFIAGPRSCVGQYFAILETKIVLSLLLQRYRFETDGPLAGLRHTKQIPICPLDNLRMKIQ